MSIPFATTVLGTSDGIRPRPHVSLSQGSARLVVLLAVLLVAAPVPTRADCSLIYTGRIPLDDLGPRLYQGNVGGLYPNGTNTIPTAHFAGGLDIALNEIRPRNASGQYNPITGKIVLISIGMSNTTQEFASKGTENFRRRALADPSLHRQLVIVDCAQGGQTAAQWRDPNNACWSVAMQRLAAAGVTPHQVQVAWIKLAERSSDLPNTTFPAHAEFHQQRLADVLRVIPAKLPNLRLGFMSSRTRAYVDNPNALNPEPIAYEENFSVKWVIEGQIDGTGNLNYDPKLGPVVAPYASWAPYLWIDGETPRSDGLKWLCSDLEADFVHPSVTGVSKVGAQLLAFFKTSPLSTPWFLRQEVVGQPPTCNILADVANGVAPLTVHFTADANDPGGQIVSYAWGFDDGTNTLTQNPTKIFPAPGQYNVRLAVTDNDGNPVTAAKLIIVTRGIPGDLNCDAEVNNFDIDPFVLALTDPAGYKAAYPGCDRMLADINRDGVVDNFDIDPFVKLLAP